LTELNARIAAMEKEERYLPTSRKSQVLTQTAYLLVLLAFCWALALVVHMGGLGLVKDPTGAALSPFGTLLEFKGNLLAAGLFALLGASGLRQTVKRLLLPDMKRLVWAWAGFLALCIPSPLTLGLYLLPSAVLVLAAIILSAAAVPPKTPEHAETHRLLLWLSVTAALFLGGLLLEEAQPLLRSWGDSSGAPPPPLVDEAEVLQVAAEKIRRLKPSLIDEIPKDVAAALEKAGCTIPQSGSESEAHNFFSAALITPEHYDWVALCSRGGYSTLHVVYEDPSSETNCAEEFAPTPEVEDLRRIGDKRGEFNRHIKPAPHEGMERLLGKAPEGGIPPLEPGLAGIEDRIAGKELRVHYCREKSWAFSHIEDNGGEPAAVPQDPPGTYTIELMPHERDGVKLD